MRHRFGEAEPLYQRALSIRETRLGPNHPGLARTLHSYAFLLNRTYRKLQASVLEVRVKAVLTSAARSAGQTVHVQDLDGEKSRII
jgi:hypothetical protein